MVVLLEDGSYSCFSGTMAKPDEISAPAPPKRYRGDPNVDPTNPNPSIVVHVRNLSHRVGYLLKCELDQRACTQQAIFKNKWILGRK